MNDNFARMESPLVKVRSLKKGFWQEVDLLKTVRGRIFNLWKGNYNKQFVNVLKDVNFEMWSGEFVGLIGKNGSGKSTFLKILAGIYDADEGQVLVAAKRVVPVLELGIGFNYDLSASDNLFISAALFGMKTPEIRRKYEQIVDFAGLVGKMGLPLGHFSSGMVARLAFSIAVHVEADLYIFDEILAVGDQDFQQKCFAKFGEMKAQGAAVIFVSHDLVAVKKLCEKIYMMDEGRLLIAN